MDTSAIESAWAQHPLFQWVPGMQWFLWSKDGYQVGGGFVVPDGNVPPSGAVPDTQDPAFIGLMRDKLDTWVWGKFEVTTPMRAWCVNLVWDYQDKAFTCYVLLRDETLSWHHSAPAGALLLAADALWNRRKRRRSP
jgi:hypothetical protein